MKEIAIFDDERRNRTLWKDQLVALPSVSESFNVRYIEEDEFRDGLTVLEGRRERARAAPMNCEWEGATFFDDAAVLVVDYDLLYFDRHESDGGSTFLTGEAVSYLARCYSRCGVIIALNQFGNTFDLTLRGHPESYADLNISSSQLGNAGLWAPNCRGFRPWYWRLIPDAIDRLEKCATAAESALESPLIELLSLPPSVVALLPRSITEFVEGAPTFEGTNAHLFVTKSGNGLKGKDMPLNPGAVARIAAARLQKWLERVVLPGQEVLVDAPHLVMRLPSLMKGATTVEEWNQTALFGRDVRLDGADSHRWTAEGWLSRPSWWWHQLRDDTTFVEVSTPWNAPRAPFVFCEDVSEFGLENDATDFVADVDSPFLRRFVVRPESELAKRLGVSHEVIEYRPVVRFAM